MAVAIQWYTFPVARNSQYFHQKHTYNSRPRRRIGAANGALWEFRTHLTARCARPVVAIYSRITLLCYRVECHQLICIISAADVIIASLIRYGVADGSSARRCLTCSRVIPFLCLCVRKVYYHVQQPVVRNEPVIAVRLFPADNYANSIFLFINSYSFCEFEEIEKWSNTMNLKVQGRRCIIFKFLIDIFYFSQMISYIPPLSVNVYQDGSSKVL